MTRELVPGVSPEVAARIRSFYRPTPPVDQEQLQREHPPPVKAIVIDRRSGDVVAVIPRATRRAPRNRPSRAGRVRTIRRQATTSRRSHRAHAPPGEEGEPEGPGGLSTEIAPEVYPDPAVASSLQLLGEEDERWRGPGRTSRPRRSGDLVHVSVLLTSLFERLAALDEDER